MQNVPGRAPADSGAVTTAWCCVDQKEGKRGQQIRCSQMEVSLHVTYYGKTNEKYYMNQEYVLLKTID